MAKLTDAALAARLRRVAEALVGPEDVRRAREVDRAISGGRLRAERIVGVLPPNATNVVQGVSVQVPPLALSASLNAAGQLTDLAAAIAARLTTEQTQDAVAAMLVAGTNITLIYDELAGTLSVAGASTVMWSVLTDGDAANPQLIFADGDIVMIQGA